MPDGALCILMYCKLSQRKPSFQYKRVGVCMCLSAQACCSPVSMWQKMADCRPHAVCWQEVLTQSAIGRRDISLRSETEDVDRQWTLKCSLSFMSRLKPQ